MKNARCLSCGFTMRGIFKHGAPKSCPACGFEKSNEVLAQIAKAKIQEKREYDKKNS
jgi:ribosomal protein L37E